MSRSGKVVFALVLSALAYVGVTDHMRLRAIDQWMSAVVGTRTLPDGTLAPLNRADGVAVLLHEALAQAAASKEPAK